MSKEAVRARRVYGLRVSPTTRLTRKYCGTRSGLCVERTAYRIRLIGVQLDSKHLNPIQSNPIRGPIHSNPAPIQSNPLQLAPIQQGHCIAAVLDCIVDPGVIVTRNDDQYY